MGRRMTLGQAMKAQRIKLGLSQADAAKRCKVRQPTISIWEGDDAWPGRANLRRISQVYQMTPEQIGRGLVATMKASWGLAS
jgi:transcriptional regulator with XRE-family HTH domain